MTAQEYHHAVATHDQRMLEAAIDRIPPRINRTGTLFKKLVREIKHELQNNHRTQRTKSKL